MVRRLACKDPLTSPVRDTWRLAPPLAAVWQAFTLVANLREQTVSCSDSASGLTLTNISVLPSPPRHGCMAELR